MQDELTALAAFVGGGERDLEAEPIGFVDLAFADAFGLRGMPRVELPAALALLLAAYLRGAANRDSEDLLQRSVSFDHAPDIADDPAQAGAQEFDLPVHALELLGVGVTPGHHRRPFCDPPVGLA